MSMETTELIETREVARRLHMTKRTVLKLVRLGKIPVVRIRPHLLRFRWEDVVKALGEP